MLRDKEWREIDSIMYKERKVYVLKDDKLRAEIIRLHHDDGDQRELITGQE